MDYTEAIRRSIRTQATAAKERERYNIKQNVDGKWQTPPRKNFYRACCDCGLVHREEYRVRNGLVQYRVFRDRAETRAERRRTGKRPADRTGSNLK